MRTNQAPNWCWLPLCALAGLVLASLACSEGATPIPTLESQTSDATHALAVETPAPTISPLPKRTEAPAPIPEATFTTTASPSPTTSLPTPSPTSIAHVVEAGDTLSAIAEKYGVSVEDLAAANGISDPSRIQVGQQLVVPSPSERGPASPTVTATLTEKPATEPSTELFIPLEIRADRGLVFTVDRIDVLESIDGSYERHRPENGVFLVLIGSISNFTDQNECAYERDFALRIDTHEYEMTQSVVKAAKDVYKIDYPGFFWGQCVDYDQTEDTYLVFDIPTSGTNLWLQFDGVEVQLGPMLALPKGTSAVSVSSTPGQAGVAPTENSTTPAPPAVPPEVQDYAAQVLPQVTLLSAAIDAIGDEASDVASGKLAMDDFILTFVVNGAIVQTAHENLLAIEPPADMVEIHSQLTTATQDCSDAMDELAAGIDELDKNRTDIAAGLMISCAEKIELTTDLLDEQWRQFE